MKFCVAVCSRITDKELEAEITRLEASPHVKLARTYDAVREERLRYLKELKKLEHRGEDLEAEGVTMELLEQFCSSRSV